MKAATLVAVGGGNFPDRPQVNTESCAALMRACTRAHTRAGHPMHASGEISRRQKKVMSSSAVVQFGPTTHREPQIESRAARIVRTGHAKVASAPTLTAQLAAAHDYTRMANAEARRSGVDASPAMAQARDLLVATADAICAAIANPGGVR